MTDGLGAWVVRRRKSPRDYGLKACPNCGKKNGRLQRGYLNVCAIGVGCRKSTGHVIGRAE